MAGNATTAQSIDRALYAQANYLGDVYAWVKKQLIQWQANCPDAATMTALGYTDATAQAQSEQHMANLNALLKLFEGTDTSAYAHSMINDLAKLQGVGG